MTSWFFHQDGVPWNRSSIKFKYDVTSEQLYDDIVSTIQNYVYFVQLQTGQWNYNVPTLGKKNDI